MEAPLPLPARTYNVTIDRDWRELYEAVWHPHAFQHWASGLADGALREEGDAWIADGPDGPSRIRFTAHNDFGVMDHWVETPDGEVHVPLRIVPNGRGAEVMLTLYRQPNMSDERFAADTKWIHRDLTRLRTWMSP